MGVDDWRAYSLFFGQSDISYNWQNGMERKNSACTICACCIPNDRCVKQSVFELQKHFFKSGVLRMKQWNWKKGSFTVEAAMIMPVVLLCLLLCIYGGMFLHDRVVLAGTAATAGHRGFRCVTENQSLLTGSPDWDQWRKKGILWRVKGFGEVGTTELYAQAAAAGRLMVTRQPVYTVAFGGNQAEISYQAETAMQWPGWSGLAEYLKISGSVSESGLEPEELLRLVKALMADQKTDGEGQ